MSHGMNCFSGLLCAALLPSCLFEVAQYIEELLKNDAIKIARNARFASSILVREAKIYHTTVDKRAGSGVLPLE